MDHVRFKILATGKKRFWTMQSELENAGEEFAKMFAAGGLPQVEAAASRNRGRGPFKRLVLRGASIIDGTGAPPWGPADVGGLRGPWGLRGVPVPAVLIVWFLGRVGQTQQG